MLTHPPQIVPLSRSSREVARFLRVSYRIYRDDPNWVAPLLFDLKKTFSDVNPLFNHAEMQLWVAVRNGEDTGRIAALEDRAHNQAQRDSEAFFGYFECENDPQTSQALFKAAFAWARERRLCRMVGPMNPTTNDECGLLVEGVDVPPVFMMPYNPRYYAEQVAAAGFRKVKDLLAYQIDLSGCPMERLARIVAKVERRWPDLKCRPILRRTLLQDLGRIKEVYNAAWERNWGFVPMTDAEVDFMAVRLKPLLRDGLVWLAEAGSEPVGFLLAVPDLNVVLQPLQGRLLTSRVLGALPYLMGWKCPPRSRVIALGVKEAFRGRGLESVMLFRALQAGFKAGLTEAEASWILEDNTLMCRVLETFGGKPYKTYRLFERDL